LKGADLLGCSLSALRVKIHDFGSGTQRVHISCPRGDVETVGDVVQTVVEKVPVLVESHRGGLVAEHSLDEFHVRARSDREARSGVPKLVRMQARPADSGRSAVEGCAPKDRRA
jgi:hypothetical protein